jgi:hypothetical protein
MAQWNESNNAPTGQYRVIGTDEFPWPHEDYWIGDCADLPQAKELAGSHVQAMNSAAVYDENGDRVFTAVPGTPKT